MPLNNTALNSLICLCGLAILQIHADGLRIQIPQCIPGIYSEDSKPGLGLQALIPASVSRQEDQELLAMLCFRWCLKPVWDHEALCKQ